MPSDKVKEILADVKKLSDADYQDFLCNAFDPTRPALTNRTIVKKIMKEGKKDAKSDPSFKSGVGQPGTAVSCPSSSSLQSSAWKTPFIFRGDLIPENGILCFDVEKVSLKKSTDQKTHVVVAETIAIVNEDKDLVFWCFVKWPEENVCQIFPHLTGLSRDKLSIGLPIEKIQEFMGMMLRGNKLIGHDLRPDLLSIGINHADVDDTADYFCEVVPPVHSKAKAAIQKYSLKDVAQHLFPLINFQCGAHSAVSDARMTLKIWKKNEEFIKSNPGQSVYFQKINRSPKNAFKFEKNDVCTCQGSSKKKKNNIPIHYYPPSK